MAKFLVDPALTPKKKAAVKPSLKPTAEKPVAPPAPKPAPNPYGLDPRVAPYLQPQLDLIKAQQTQQQDALTAFTKAVLGQLQGMTPGIESDYNQAIDQSRSLAQAGSDSLKAANGNDAIQAILQSAGAPDAQRASVATNLNNVFNGGAAALFGSEGVAPGQQLIGDKAAQLAFSRELPGINALAGTQALHNLLAQSGLAQQKVLAEVPNVMGDLAKNSLAAKQATADAAYKKKYLDYLGGQLSVKNRQTGASINQGRARISIAQQNADTAAQRAADAAAAARARIEIARKNAGKKAGPKPPTGGQLSSMIDKWYAGTTGSQRVPVLDDQGKQKVNPNTGAPITTVKSTRGGQLSYQQAYRRLLALKVPQAQAIGLLNTKYKRGERKRPWLGIQERAALAKFSTSTSARYYKRHAWLSPGQVSILTNANLLPAGENVGGRYFIAPSY